MSEGIFEAGVGKLLKHCPKSLKKEKMNMIILILKVSVKELYSL